MEPKIDLAKQVMTRALKNNGVSETETHEIVFHLTDWLDDLKPFVDFLEKPEIYKDEEIRRILIRFLVHAPDHLKTAAETIMEAGGQA